MLIGNTEKTGSNDEIDNEIYCNPEWTKAL